jgi:hypothetical protein
MDKLADVAGRRVLPLAEVTAFPKGCTVFAKLSLKWRPVAIDFLNPWMITDPSS